MRFSTSIAFLGLANYVNGHASIFHPSMLGFNVTGSTFPYDNRPVSPLTNYTFEQWWMHGHLAYPPHPEDVFELPAGQNVTTEIACTKSATSYFASSEGGNIQNGNDPCPGSPPSEYHTTGISDVKGCALAIAYKDDFNTTQPEDFTVFSVNQTCVWNRFTDFSVPERMPACPNGKCICAWFWIHSEDSGGEQNYMTAFQCNVTGATSDVSLATPQPPRRCGADPKSDKAMPSPGNCTYGAKQPFYWFQAERNNMFEGTYSPPFYLDLYGFVDGPQLDIFNDSYHEGKPAPSANQTALPQLKTIVQGQKLPVPNLSLLPTDFLAKVESAALSPIIFAPTSSLMPISSSAPTLTSALPSSSLEPTFSVAITPAASPLAPSNSISLSSPLLSTSSVTVASSSSLAASTVTVTNVVTVVVQVAAALPTASSSTAVSLNSTSPLDAVNATDHSRIELALPPATVLLDANSTDQVISPDPTSRSRTCKQDPHILVAQDDSKTRRSLTERLGMGTYTYRKVHKRSIWSVL